MNKILLVENDRPIADGIRRALLENTFEVEHCILGADALEYLSKNQVDLVLLDIGLDDITGLAMIQHIKEITDIPVIFITGFKTDADEVLGLKLGAIDYIRKPFTHEVLISRIKIALRDKTISGDSSEIFKIDNALQRIIFKSQPLRLTSYHFNILSYLIKHPNTIHSKIDLLNVLEGIKISKNSEAKRVNYQQSDTAVRDFSQHIMIIRKEIRKKDPNHEYIETHSGKGYSLKV